jgi:hypothetical protein
MNSYLLKLYDREEGPYSEEQVSQLFADGRVDRNTPCRLGTTGAWKTIDDYLPNLKYGTQLPAPTSPLVRSEDSPIYGARSSPPSLPTRKVPAGSAVKLVDIDLPFLSIVKLLFKWAAAAFLVFCCFIPVLIILLFTIMAIFGSLLSGIFSGFHHP